MGAKIKLGDGCGYVFFKSLLAMRRLPEPVEEYKFHPKRRWRMDFAWPDQKIALEVEGGVWSGGRHTRGSGFIKDMEKYNTATLMGYRLIRVTPQQMGTGEAVELVEQLLGGGDGSTGKIATSN